MIRKSTENDKELIQQLMLLFFGFKDNLEPYENLDGRYYLYFKDNKLVAMTGVIFSDEYMGLEIDWTCTHPDYRHNGFMQELFRVMLNGVYQDVYCSCWRLPNSDKVNLHTLMYLFGFKEVIKSRVHWKVPYNCFRNYKNDCVNCTGINCECYEDLYLRKVNM